MVFEEVLQQYIGISGVGWSIKNVKCIHLALTSWLSFIWTKGADDVSSYISKCPGQTELLLTTLFPKYKAVLTEYKAKGAGNDDDTIHNSLYQYITGEKVPDGYHIPTVYIMPQGDKSALCKFCVVPIDGSFSTWKQFKKACMRHSAIIELG